MVPWVNPTGRNAGELFQHPAAFWNSINLPIDFFNNSRSYQNINLLMVPGRHWIGNSNRFQ
jgi:hypothetical protein